MSQRYAIRRIPVLLTLALASLWFLPEASASPLTVLEETDIRSLSPTAASGVCTLDNGVFGGFGYGWTPLPDNWYLVATRIRPSDCAACPVPSVLQLHSVSVRVRGLVACSATVDVYVVGSNGDALCPAPDTTQILCPPVSHTLDIVPPPGVVYTLPLSSDCCIDDEAFVVVRFRDLAECDAAGNPIFLYASTSPCTDCEQYFVTTQSHTSLTESCDWLDNPIWMSVDADCCEPVQALNSSWGRIKSLYR